MIADFGLRIEEGKKSELKLPAARLVDELKSSRYGECARWSIFRSQNSESMDRKYLLLSFDYLILAPGYF